MAPSIPSPCLSDNTIADVITGNLALDRVSAIESHIDRCDPCRVLLARAAISGVAALSRDPTGAPHASGARGEGAVVGEGQYAIVREIARGGMGRIVEAWDIRHGRTVALKLLLHDAPLARERFAREVRITALLQHPSVVPLYEAGRFASGEPFFVMKLVSGESLDAAASRATTPLQRMRLVPHLIAVTEAIAYAHDKRVIHRDLKPSNVLVGAFGETVVIDWGLAKHLEVAGDQDASGERSLPGGPEHEALTGAGHAVGTPAYMAPEQARGGVADERADVYALGAMIYRVLSGEAPYEGVGAKAVLARVVEGPPPDLDARAPALPPDLVAIVRKAMARDPDDRYPDARAMADDLARYAAGQLVSAREYSLASLVRRWVARRRAVVATATVLVLALALTATLGVRRTLGERTRADTARKVADDQRARAEVQRDAAEHLVDFVVGQLKDRLVPVGRLDLLAGVGGEVERYYASLPAPDGAADLDAIGRRATALETLAQVEEDKSDNKAVMSLRSLARDLREAVARARPDDAESAALATEDAEQIAAAVWKQGDHEASLQQAGAASARARALLARFPDEPFAGRAAARVDASFCNLLLYVPDAARARDACEHARDAALAVVARHPEDAEAAQRLGRAYYYLGNWEVHFGARDAAGAAYASSVAGLRALVERDPSRSDRRRALADSLARLGEADVRSGHLDDAASALEESLAIRVALAGRDPDDLELTRQAMIGHNGIGALHVARDELQSAQASYGESLKIARALVAARPDDAVYQDDLGYSLRSLGETLLAQGKLEESRAAFSEAAEVCAAMARANLSNRRAVYTSALSLRGVVMAERRLRHFDAARAAFDRGDALLTGLLAQSDERLYRKAAALLSLAGGDLFMDVGDAKRAEGLERRALEIWTALFEKNPTDTDLAVGVADTATHLAATLSAQPGTRDERRALLTTGLKALAPQRDAGTISPGDRSVLTGLERALARLD